MEHAPHAALMLGTCCATHASWALASSAKPAGSPHPLGHVSTKPATPTSIKFHVPSLSTTSGPPPSPLRSVYDDDPTPRWNGSFQWSNQYHGS